MSLIEVLKSNDREMKSRGISLLYSILTISPVKILNNFQDYYDILMEISSEGIGLETINLLIIEQTIKEMESINEESAPFLINYICYFIENPFLIEKISLEQDISATTQMFHEALKGLFRNRKESFCIPERIRSLLATKDDYFILKFAAENDSILDYIIKNREPSLTYLINCLNLEEKTIVDYSTKILIRLKTKEPAISQHISRYISYNNQLFNQNVNQLMKSTMSNNISFLGSAEDTYKTTIQFMIKNGEQFAYLQPSEVNFYKQKTGQNDVIKNTEAYSFLNTAHLEQNSMTQIQRRPPVVKHDVNDLPICAILQKQGKFKKWQERYFEFYPTSKCLLWRSKPDDPKVKGVLLFDDTYEIKQVNEKNKLILQLTPKKGKQYFLAFSNDDERSKWSSLISNAISN